MANYVDPTIDWLLTRYPEYLKLADQTPSSASSSSVQASAAQPETRFLKVDEPHVKKSEKTISNKLRVQHV